MELANSGLQISPVGLEAKGLGGRECVGFQPEIHERTVIWRKTNMSCLDCLAVIVWSCERRTIWVRDFSELPCGWVFGVD